MKPVIALVFQKPERVSASDPQALRSGRRRECNARMQGPGPIISVSFGRWPDTSHENPTAFSAAPAIPLGPTHACLSSISTPESERANV